MKEDERNAEVQRKQSILRCAIVDYLKGNSNMSVVKEIAAGAIDGQYSQPDTISSILCEIIKSEYMADYRPPDSDGELRLAALMDAFQIRPPQLDGDRTWTRFVMLCTIQDMDDGKFPARVTMTGVLPFVMEAGERVAWVFQRAEFLADQVVHSGGRNYGGVSVRVMPGMYVHTGASAPQQSQVGYVSEGWGMLAVTDRYLYFKGDHQSLRVRLGDIIAFGPSNEGFTFCTGGASSRNHAFVTGDNEGWFSYALTKALATNGSALQ